MRNDTKKKKKRGEKFSEREKGAKILTSVFSMQKSETWNFFANFFYILKTLVNIFSRSPFSHSLNFSSPGQVRYRDKKTTTYHEWSRARTVSQHGAPPVLSRRYCSTSVFEDVIHDP